MGARRSSDHAELKEKIINTAKEIIAERGLSALNVREIAKRVGCAVGMPYKVLKGIDDILIHVNGQILDDLHALIRDAIKKNDKLERIGHKMAAAYIQYFKTHPHYWSALFEYHYDDNFQIPAQFDEKIATIFLTIESALLPALNNDAEKAFTAARVFWAGVHGICTLSQRGTLARIKIRSEKELIDSLVSGCLSAATTHPK